MEPLNLVTINTFSPYSVWNKGDVYYFETDYGVEYSVDFDLDDNPYYEAEQQQKYLIKATEVKGESLDGKNLIEYVALIVQRSHPHLDDIINLYDEEIEMFNEYKP